MGASLESVLVYGSISVSVAAALFTILPGRGAAPPQAVEKDDQDNFRWGLMGFLSVFPLFNWLAWVFAAIDSENPRPYYYLAALYALPLLRSGFDLDWFSWTMLGLGAVHVQAARIAATEPDLRARIAEQLKPLNLLKASASAARTTTSVAFGIGEQAAPSSQGQRQQLPPQTMVEVKDALFSEKDIEEEEAYNKKLLQEFDQQLNQRQGQKDDGTT